ncbi:MAG: tetratricopeptide repeat protein [Planctomycetaceae bacterium]|nr:tetratricopeptide repeat protein [Planctomycetaceae bacterium]
MPFSFLGIEPPVSIFGGKNARFMNSIWNHCLTSGVFRAATGCLILLLSVGCTSLRPRAPVERDVLLARQLSQQGLDALDRGQIEQAENHFSEALDRCPANVNARCHLADCLWKRGESQNAIAQLSDALAISEHDDTQILVRLGQMKFDVGEHEAAQKLVNRALQASPEDPGAWQLDGAIKHQRDEWTAALASYQRSLCYHPNDVETQLAVAEIYANLKRPGRTLSTLERLEQRVVQDQHRQRMLAIKGYALHGLRRYEEASETLLLAIESGAPSPELLANLAKAQFESGQYREARQTIRHALPVVGPEQTESLQRLMTKIAANEQTAGVRVR